MTKCPLGTCRGPSAGSEVSHFLPGLFLEYSGSFVWEQLTWAQRDLLTSSGQNTTNGFSSAPFDLEAEERDLLPLECQRSDIRRRRRRHRHTSTFQMQVVPVRRHQRHLLSLLAGPALFLETRE